MSDEILDQYEKTLEAAVVPSYFLPEQFCNNGVQSVDYIIPPAFSANPKQASLETGAPPLQQVKPNLGGAYFPRQEYNGIFRLVTNILAYLNSGYNFTFDTKNTGGYQSNAVLYDYATGKFVQSLEDGNTNNFITDPTLIDGTHWRFISVNPNTSNDFTVSPVVPTRPTGEQSKFTANMQALWNQTLGIGIGLNGQAVKSFNSVTDLYNTVNGGCYFGHGAVMPDPEGYYYMTRIASNDTNGTGAFLATDNSKIYFGFANPTIYSWTQMSTVEQLQNGTFAATLLSLVAQFATLGTAGVATGSLAIYGNQPTNPVNFVFAGNGSAGAGAYINANYDNANQVAFINFPYKLSDGITLARPCLGNSNAASDQIAKLADITANGGGIVASGSNSNGWWRKYADGWIEQGGYTTTLSSAVSYATLPISFAVGASTVQISPTAALFYVAEYSISVNFLYRFFPVAINQAGNYLGGINVSWFAAGY